ncbi:hypothetical protein EXIGLDRAFT_473411 [Exidia glandulosa HHB12029]|uniref:Uncharacterized protein n=1 Tax=Exidia glandulosa HHB12029 TaxID=1314781 RepID=A0A165JYB1_EXIGL|nr:hypothetical protein EXIGLDRAFT_473411 [Exidia glandulosa HHB12029]
MHFLPTSRPPPQRQCHHFTAVCLTEPAALLRHAHHHCQHCPTLCSSQPLQCTPNLLPVAVLALSLPCKADLGSVAICGHRRNGCQQGSLTYYGTARYISSLASHGAFTILQVRKVPNTTWLSPRQSDAPLSLSCNCDNVVPTDDPMHRIAGYVPACSESHTLHLVVRKLRPLSDELYLNIRRPQEISTRRVELRANTDLGRSVFTTALVYCAKLTCPSLLVKVIARSHHRDAVARLGDPDSESSFWGRLRRPADRIF